MGVDMRYILLALVLIAAFFRAAPALAGSVNGISLAARVEPKSISAIIAEPMIIDYDLSPDGKRIALLASPGTNWTPLWVIVLEVNSGRIVKSVKLGSGEFPWGNESPQVLFSSDQHYLVVQDLKTIRVFDSSTLNFLRAIPPPSGSSAGLPLYIAGASGRDVFVCAFGRDQKLIPGFHVMPSRIEVVNIETGERLGEWNSDDLPQAISPEGDRVAISTLNVKKGLLPLGIFDLHGKEVAELDGGFSYLGTPPPPGAFGRVLGLFTRNNRILLSPGSFHDKTGHLSGDSIEVFDLLGRKAIHERSLRPDRFAPLGDWGISADGHVVAATSWYIPPQYLIHGEGPWPPPTMPKILIINPRSSSNPVAEIPVETRGLASSGWMEDVRPRLSADGSTLAIAQKNGIDVFSLVAIPGDGTH